MIKPLRVLMVDSSEANVEPIRQELSLAGLQPLIERVECGEKFETAIRDFEPDIVLSDHSLAQFDVRAALSALRKLRPATPLIIFSSTFNGETTVAYLRAGAEDVVLKANIGRLATSISNAVSVRRPLQKLTRRQIEVLRMVADGHRTRDIADRLKLSVKTVESHRGEVMKRLDMHDVVSLVRYAVRVGLVSTTELTTESTAA